MRSSQLQLLAASRTAAVGTWTTATEDLMSVETKDYITLVQQVRTGVKPQAIPVMDLAPFFSGAPGALEAAA